MASESKRILLVEDDPSLRDLILSQLDRHDIISAAHQQAAYEALEATPFDLVLLDLRLPVDERDINPNSGVGFEILEMIREQSRLDRTAVVVMTAYEGTSETTKRALKSGATEYWNKDGTYSEDLFGLVTRVLDDQEAQRQRAAEAESTRRYRLDFDGRRKRVVFDGAVTFRGKQYELLDVLRQVGCEASDSDRTFIRLAPLSDKLRIDQEYTRKLVERIRRGVETHCNVGCGTTPDRNAVIEHQDWKGYRLNPVRVEIADIR